MPLDASRDPPRLPPLVLRQTDPAHLVGALNGSAQFGVDPHAGYEIHPVGNAVPATMPYTHSLTFSKTALGKG